MKQLILCAAFILALTAFQACQNTNKTSNDPDSLTTTMVDSANIAMEDTAGINNNDTAQFMNRAAIGGKMEVEFGKLAQQQSNNAEVKEFAAMIVKDHSKANTELKRVAETNKIALDDTYPKDVQTHLDNMKTMKGAEFDRHYMKMMVRDHAKDIALFKAATKHPNAEISNFATKTLPVLEKHQQRAIAIEASFPQ
jgi:putative membrane protein